MVVGEDSGGAGSGAPKDHPTLHRGGRCRGHHEQVREEGKSVGERVIVYVHTYVDGRVSVCVYVSGCVSAGVAMNFV